MLSRVADLLAERPEHPGRLPGPAAVAGVRVARPARRAAQPCSSSTPTPTTPTPDTGDAPTEPAPTTEPGPEPEPEPGTEPALPRALAFPADLLGALRNVDPDRLRPRGVLYVHLHEAALTGAGAGWPGSRGSARTASPS